jgi:hypothetical protein
MEDGGDERRNGELVLVLCFIVKFSKIRDKGGGAVGRMVEKENEKKMKKSKTKEMKKR